MDRYDIAVIGSGPAGHAAAIQAAKLGKRTAVIEKSAAIGGASVNLGTIPSKAFRESVVPLSTLALEILDALPRFDGGDFVFTTMSGESPVSGFSKSKWGRSS